MKIEKQINKLQNFLMSEMDYYNSDLYEVLEVLKINLDSGCAIYTSAEGAFSWAFGRGYTKSSLDNIERVLILIKNGAKLSPNQLLTRSGYGL